MEPILAAASVHADGSTEPVEPTPGRVLDKTHYALGATTLVLFGVLGLWFWLLAPNMPWPIKLTISEVIQLGALLPYWECRESWHNNETPDILRKRMKSQLVLTLILNSGFAVMYYITPS